MERDVTRGWGGMNFTNSFLVGWTLQARFTLSPQRLPIS